MPSSCTESERMPVKWSQRVLRDRGCVLFHRDSAQTVEVVSEDRSDFPYDTYAALMETIRWFPPPVWTAVLFFHPKNILEKNITENQSRQKRRGIFRLRRDCCIF